MPFSQYDKLVDIYSEKMEKYGHFWKIVETTLNSKINSNMKKINESTYESSSYLRQKDHSVLIETSKSDIIDGNSPVSSQEEISINNIVVNAPIPTQSSKKTSMKVC